MSTFDVIGEIYEERREQAQREGHTSDHDDGHRCGELALAAAAYCVMSAGHYDDAEKLWPWQSHEFKPKRARRDLIRAAALIVAEIERLDRAARKAA